MSIQLPVQFHLRPEVGNGIEHLFELVQEFALTEQVAAFESQVGLSGLQQFVEASSIRWSSSDRSEQGIHSLSSCISIAHFILAIAS